MKPFRFGVGSGRAGSAAEWVELAQRVESLGYSTLIIPDRLGALLSPFAAMGLLAGRTTRLRFGTYVAVSALRNPIMLAHEAATVDFLSAGRLELGIGPGAFEGDFRLAGVPFETGARRLENLADTVSQVRAYWSASDPTRFPRPVQSPIPVLISAGGRKGVAYAAREADTVALGTGREAPGWAAFKMRSDWLQADAGPRWQNLEVNVMALAVGNKASYGLKYLMGLTLDELVALDSPLAILGDEDQMVERLQKLREQLGISYVSVPEDLMESFAPIVRRLAGTE
jgi:probable F420-dependent oxidoreductase